MKHIVFALCEGPHDIAFLYRLFITQGFENYKQKISQFPTPIDSLILGALKSTDYENMKLMDLRPKPIPTEILQKRDALILLYSIGGDSKRETREQLVSDILEFKPVDDGGYDAGQGLDYSIIYFFDADDIGVENRLNNIEKEIKVIFDVDKIGISNGGPLLSIKGYKVGCYIFANSDGYGKLEDIMVPLMEKDNEEIFQKASQFLRLKDDARLKKLKIKKNSDGSVEEIRSNKKLTFDESKSQISIAGQLQNSGKSNVVIIKDCDYINLPKIQASKTCIDIMNFINQAVL